MGDCNHHLDEGAVLHPLALAGNVVVAEMREQKGNQYDSDSVVEVKAVIHPDPDLQWEGMSSNSVV